MKHKSRPNYYNSITMINSASKTQLKIFHRYSKISIALFCFALLAIVLLILFPSNEVVFKLFLTSLFFGLLTSVVGGIHSGIALTFILAHAVKDKEPIWYWFNIIFFGIASLLLGLFSFIAVFLL